MDLLHNFWFIQGIGVVGLIFSLLSWNSRTRKKILELQAMNGLAFSIHYFLLDAFAGTLMNLLTVVRNIVFTNKNDKKWANHTAWLYLFISLSVVGVLFSWVGWITLLPALGVIVGTYAIYQNDPARIRLLILIACLIWIPYTIYVKSYTGLISQIVAIIGVLFGIYRLDRKEKNNE